MTICSENLGWGHGPVGSRLATPMVQRELYCSVVAKRELSKTAKLSLFKSVFVPILTCVHES